MSDYNSGISRASDMITGVARALVGLLIALIVLFVLAGIVFPTDVAVTGVPAIGTIPAVVAKAGLIPDVIHGIKTLVSAFLNGSFAGLLALILFVGFLTHGRD
jgi:hypothetical protein